jgi:hypothetical protein
MGPLQTAYAQLRQFGIYYRGGGMPQSCGWTTAELPREGIDGSVITLGTGVHVQYGFHDSAILDMANAPSRVRVELSQGWSIVFGTAECPKDGQLTTRLAFITSQWENTVGYTHPWQIRLEWQPWRIGEGGDICAKVFPEEGKWGDERVRADAALCAR